MFRTITFAIVAALAAADKKKAPRKKDNPKQKDQAGFVQVDENDFHTPEYQALSR